MKKSKFTDREKEIAEISYEIGFFSARGGEVIKSESHLLKELSKRLGD